MKDVDFNFNHSPFDESILHPNERILYSLMVGECSEQLFGYKLDLTTFEGHITNERFILFAEKFPKWMKYVIDVAFLILDAPVGAEQQTKHNFKREEKYHDSIKGEIISFPKQYIERFELVKNLFTPQFTRIKFTKEGQKIFNKKEFVFCPTPSKEARKSIEFGQIDFSNAYLGGQFADIGNKWLVNSK